MGSCVKGISSLRRNNCIIKRWSIVSSPLSLNQNYIKWAEPFEWKSCSNPWVINWSALPNHEAINSQFPDQLSTLSAVSQTPDHQVVPYVSRSQLMLTLTQEWWKYFHFQVSLFSSLHTIYIKANYSQESDSSAYQDYSLENWQLLNRSNLGF